MTNDKQETRECLMCNNYAGIYQRIHSNCYNKLAKENEELKLVVEKLEHDMREVRRERGQQL